MWPLVPLMDDFAASELFDLRPDRAYDFCATCGRPGPWVSREKLLQWIRHQLQADPNMSGATRLELLASMDRLEGMAADDSKAIAGWEQIKKPAPKVWDTIKPVIQTVAGEAVKKQLGL
jgi:hypothetical protein